jgi:hypothetical protein
MSEPIDIVAFSELIDDYQCAQLDGGLDERANARSALMNAYRAALSPSNEANDARLSATDIEAGWHRTFSTGNPYCPCNLKSFTKAVRWAECAIAKEPK